MATRLLACSECGAELNVPETRRTTTCPYCKCANIVSRPPTPDAPSPALVLPFVATEQVARAAVAAWQSKWRFTRQSLSDATIASIEGVYMPGYLYSAALRSQYRATIGENYTETETYTEMENGKSVTKTRTVTRTEHRSLAGERLGYVTDVLVTASKGLPNDELEHIEPFDMRLLRRYDPALIAGWTTEEPTLVPGHCIQQARAEALAIEARRVADFMPGDSSKIDDWNTDVQRESLDLTLVAVWVIAIRPDPAKPARRVLVNGQTAAVWGEERWSWPKIALWVLALLAVVAAIVLASKGGRR